MHSAHSASAFDVESPNTGSVVSFSPEGQPARVPGGGFTLPKLISLTDKVAYDVWKNTIGYFQLGDHSDSLMMPVAYQSLQDDVT